MGRSVVVKVLSVLANLAVCLAAAGAVVFFQEGFGSGDLYALLFWTMPLAIGLAVSGRDVLSLMRRGSRWVRWLLIAVTGAVISFGFVWLVYLVMGPWINAFSVPIFYLWTVGAFAQLLVLDLALPPLAERKPARVIWGILVLPGVMIASVLGMYVLSFAWAFATRPEKETFLIPRDFKGTIRIVYGEECGIRPLHENGGRVLVIPESGILIIQPEFEAGRVNHAYYFVDEKGDRVKANVFDDHGRRPGKRVRLASSGTLGGVVEEGGSAGESPREIDFTDIYVQEGDSAELSDLAYRGWDPRIDSLTWALVEECRGE